MRDLIGEGSTANPIGIDVDFDQLVQCHAAGEPEETLLAYPAPAAT